MAKEDIEKVIDEVAEAAETDPVVDGLKKVAKFTSEQAKKSDAAIENLKAEVAGKLVTIEKKLTNFDEKNERGMNDVIDRVDLLSKRTSFSARSAFDQDDMSAVKEAIPERFRKNWNAYELAARKDGKAPSFDEVVKFAVQDVYYKDSTKLQMRNFGSERSTIEPEFFGFVDKLNKISKADMGGAVNTSGGYAVPDIVGNEVLKIVRDASLIYSRARQIPMTSDTLSFPDENTAVTINWVAEGGTLTGGEPVFGVKTLTAKKLAGRAVFSLELLDDSNVAIVPFLQSCFAEKMGGELDFQAMEGPGTVFTGVLGAVSVGTTNATNGTNGTNITYNGSASTQSSLVKVYVGANEGITRNDGIFVCGPSVYAKIIGLVDNNQQPVVRLGTVEGQPNNTLFGRPIVVSARLTKFTVGAGTVSVGGLYYGSPSALLFGTRQGMRWDVTDQVHWGNYQADARMVGRFGFVVGVPTAWVRQADIIV